MYRNNTIARKIVCRWLSSFTSQANGRRMMAPTTRMFSSSTAICSQERRATTVTPFISPNRAAALAAVEVKRQEVLKKSKWTKTRQTRREVPKLTPKMIASYPSVTFRIRRIKGSWKKVHPISRFIIGMSAREAVDQLTILPHKYARVVGKFLRSSMLNCENVHGMNADRLLITECSVGRGKMIPRIRIHARGRFGIQHKCFSNLRMKLVEVPPIEGERKLGRWGWNNKTWEKFHQFAETELPQKFPHIFSRFAHVHRNPEEETQKYAAAAAAAAAGGGDDGSGSGASEANAQPSAAAAAAAGSTAAHLKSMSDEELEKHFKSAMENIGKREYTEEEIAEAERQLKEVDAMFSKSESQEEIIDVDEDMVREIVPEEEKKQAEEEEGEKKQE